jgi:hypothetical protein
LAQKISQHWQTYHQVQNLPQMILMMQNRSQKIRLNPACAQKIRVTWRWSEAKKSLAQKIPRLWSASGRHARRANLRACAHWAGQSLRRQSWTVRDPRRNALIPTKIPSENPSRVLCCWHFLV